MTVIAQGHTRERPGLRANLRRQGACALVLDARAAAAFDNAKAGGDSLAQLGDMGDDADGAAALAQLVEHVEHLVERVLVERAEALVDEQRLQAAAAGLGGDDVGEPEREREAGEEGLAAGERGGRTLLAGPAID